MRARASAEARGATALLVCLALAAGACAPRSASIVLPTGAGRPADAGELAAAMDALRAPCREVTALTADVRLAGRVDGERLRGTLQVGVDATGVRIEGVPPFGAPVFVLAGRRDTATLLFVRDDLYVADAPVAALTDAIIGVALTPGDLLTLLAGCGVATDDPVSGAAYGAAWTRLDLPGGVRAWVTTPRPTATPILRVVETPVWRVDYDTAAAGPVRGTLRRAGHAGTQLTFEVQAPERLAALPAAAYDVRLPATARPLPIDQLRRQRALAEP